MTNEIIDVGPDRGAATTKIFISYSRKDMGFADRLETALKTRGFEVLIDRTEIYAFEDWWTRIQVLIAKADTVIFALSPSAVGSEVCAREVAFAASLSKRFAPVVCERVDARAVPEALARLNFISFDDPARFDDSMERLVEALQTDIGWVRKHTELGELSRRWTAAGRPGPRGLMLRSPMLEEAEQWIASRPRGAPPPTEATQTFIAESRRAATQRRNVLTGSLGAGLVVALALAGLAYWQRAIAVEQESIARQQRDSALLTQSRFLADRANGLMKAGDAGSATLLALEGLNGGISAIVRPYSPDAESALFSASQGLRELAVWRGEAFAFSPNRRQLIVIVDGTAVIVDSETHAPRVALEGRVEAGPVAFTPNGQRVVMLNFAEVLIWDANSGKRMATLSGIPDALAPATVTATGNRAVTDAYADGVGGFTISDAETGKAIRSIPGKQFAISADGRRFVTDWQDSKGQIWDVDTGKVIAVLESEAHLTTELLLSPDGRRIVAASNDNKLQLWDGDTGKSIAVLADDLDGADLSLGAFSSDGRRLMIAPRRFGSTGVALWDANAGKKITALEGENAGTVGLAFSPDGKLATTIEIKLSATPPEVNVLRVWNAETGEPLFQPQNGISTALFSPDSQRIAMLTDAPPSVSICLVDGGTCTSLAGHTGRITAAQFSPDGNHIATVSGPEKSPGIPASSSDGTLRLWDAKINPRNPPIPFSGIVTDKDGYANCARNLFAYPGVAFSKDDRRGVTWVGDEASIWDVTPLRCRVTLTGHSDLLTGASFSPNGRQVVTTSFDKTARVWDADSGAPIVTLSGHESHVLDAKFSPDGQRIVTASGSALVQLGNKNLGPPDDNTARIWDASSGALIMVLAGHKDAVRSAQFISDGTQILTVSRDNTARVWDAATGRVIATLSDPNGAALQAIGLYPDGSKVAVVFAGPSFKATQTAAEAEGGARIYEAKSGRLLFTLDLKEEVLRLAFSPDGKRLATVAKDGKVRVRNVATGQVIATLRADRDLSGAMFSANSERIATSSDDGIVVWDIASAKPVASLKLGASFKFFDQRVEPMTINGLYRVWRNYQTTQELLAFAVRINRRCLTEQQREEAYLSPEPAEWCIANEKWPYDDGAWKAWLKSRKANPNAPPPGHPARQAN